MKVMCVPLGVVSAVALLWAAMSLQAAEKGGLLVEISKKVVGRNDRVTVNGVGNMSIDHDVTLKLDIKNTSNKEFPQTPVDSIVLVERWGMSESASIERYTGTAKIDALHPAQNTSVDVGQFHIGGHMHGSSDRHLDKVVGWKVTLVRDGQKLEFTSSSNFDTVDRRSKPATDGPRQPQ